MNDNSFMNARHGMEARLISVYPDSKPDDSRLP